MAGRALHRVINVAIETGYHKSSKLAFSKKLQAVTNRIHSTNNIDEIILDVSRDICQLFEADRMTIYTMSEDGGSIVSKVKTGLNSFKDIKLPISESSLAGFCAKNRGATCASRRSTSRADPPCYGVSMAETAAPASPPASTPASTEGAHIARMALVVVGLAAGFALVPRVTQGCGKASGTASGRRGRPAFLRRW